jgi:hypothetical protein
MATELKLTLEVVRALQTVQHELKTISKFVKRSTRKRQSCASSQALFPRKRKVQTSTKTKLPVTKKVKKTPPKAKPQTCRKRTGVKK